jgi:hypothetical protein
MAAVEKITLYPMHGIAGNFGDDFPFDVSVLPALIVPDVTLEQIPVGLLTPETFGIFRELSPRKPSNRSRVFTMHLSTGFGVTSVQVKLRPNHNANG